jgi:hypothetical protein
MESNAPLRSVTNKAKKTPLNIVVVVMLLLLIALGYCAGYYFIAYTRLQQSIWQEQDLNKPLLEKLAKLVILPEVEVPTVATVSDVSKLQDQAFFKNAQNGDSIVAYPNAQIAILYRQSINKVVWMGPIIDKENLVPVPTIKTP